MMIGISIGSVSVTIFSIFRCTLSSVPQTQELLKKSRLPFGLTLQPFRDMKVSKKFLFIEK